jgi:hypothetical protein
MKKEPRHQPLRNKKIKISGNKDIKKTLKKYGTVE